ncbi:hypothetical protein HJ590_09415 [Naumannella sp. ID2617S]|nr:hypothetical protein [Naumannella sp. ID2617S]
MLKSVKESAKINNHYGPPRCDANIPEVTVLSEKGELPDAFCYALPKGALETTEKFYIKARSIGPMAYHE